MNNKKRTNKKYNKKSKKYKLKKHTIKKHHLIKGGSSIYYDGEITKTSLTYNGIPFFRKIFFYSKNPTENQKKIVLAEKSIVKLLMKNPHPNIATYFNVNVNFVDMEELDITNIMINNEIKEIMKNVKDFLQGLGIMYIDWKIDNIGKGQDGNYKLFDFDSSGLIDEDNNWKIEPVHFWSYKNAIKNGCTKPKDIDDWSFNYNILQNN